jgi:hypothetical protein
MKCTTSPRGACWASKWGFTDPIRPVTVYLPITISGCEGLSFKQRIPEKHSRSVRFRRRGRHAGLDRGSRVLPAYRAGVGEDH